MRKILGKLTAEVGRREKRGKETRKLRRNIRYPIPKTYFDPLWLSLSDKNDP